MRTPDESERKQTIVIGRIADIEYNNVNIKLLVKQISFYNQIIYELCRYYEEYREDNNMT